MSVTEPLSRPPESTRVSLLAVIALVVSLLSCPCLLTALSHWVGDLLPPDWRKNGRYGDVHFWIRVGAMAFATALSALSLWRIGAWRGALRGEEIAWTALIISLVWWASLLGICLFFGLTGAGSPG